MLARSSHREWPCAVDCLNARFLPRVDSAFDAGFPQCAIHIETGDARRRRMNRRLNFRAVGKYARLSNPRRVCDQLPSLLREQPCKQVQRFCGNKLATDFVARKATALEQ